LQHVTNTSVQHAVGTTPQYRWTASMVRPLSDQGVGTPASFVAKTFTLASVGGNEVLRISALGSIAVSSTASGSAMTS
jgi:alpha-L-rhamnosidase